MAAGKNVCRTARIPESGGWHWFRLRGDLDFWLLDEAGSAARCALAAAAALFTRSVRNLQEGGIENPAESGAVAH